MDAYFAAQTMIPITVRFHRICMSIVAVTLGCGFAAACAETIIRCNSLVGKEVVTIVLSGERKFGRSLNCIEGDFVEDMTPCAPNGGFGLSAPTGAALLSRLVYRWQDYTDHGGGVVGSSVSSTRIYFSGGWMAPPEFSRLWEFEVDRVSGSADLTIYENDQWKLMSAYKCKKYKKLF